MTEALELPRSGNMSHNKTAEACSVPYSTFMDRMSGQVQHNCHPGPKPYLQRDEEEELTSYLLSAASIAWTW